MTCSNRKLQRMHSVVEGKEALQVCVVLIVRNYCGVVDVGLGTMATWIWTQKSCRFRKSEDQRIS